MTLNITAINSTSPYPVRTELRPKVGPQEDTTQQARNSSDPVTQPGNATTTETPLAKAPALGSKVQDAKTQDAKALAKAVDELNERFKGLSRTGLQFNIDDKADQLVVKVMDVEKDEVIRQIPPKEILALAAFLKEKADKETQQMEQAAGLAPEASALEGLLLRARA